MIEYVALAVAPGAFWLWFFWRKDRYEREPASCLIKSFFLGAGMVIPAALLEEIVIHEFGMVDEILVGVIEETLKFLAIYLYMYKKSQFNEVMDGIIYSAAAALGFASLENLFYIYSYGASVMLGRATISTLGHVLFASFWGYALGLKKSTGKNTIPIGLALSIIAHGIFNTILMAPNWYINVLVVPLMVVLYRSMSGKMRKSLEQSPFKESAGSVDLMEPLCSHCGRNVPPGSSFCPHCGERL
ncbi:MAG: PrsW family intramembrane metalloprotease [Theionarchaea archaeon]|nr:PrsW family intramembrane metalloprotease [Theionarchaea archaeon]MBU7035630.1 PrsW family intramembrane metalloprotease [Theionarchaea archaeon]MBU7041167.1 PrsW family intramembrane metalloprotease [Theionarchaea archaeon]